MKFGNVELVVNWYLHWENSRIAAERNPAQHFRQRTVAGPIGSISPDCLVDIGCERGDFLAFLALRFPAMRLVDVAPRQTGAQATKRVVGAGAVPRYHLAGSLRGCLRYG